MPSWALSIGADGVTGGADGLGRRFREASPPVIGRIENERVLLDPRTVLPEEDEALLRAVGEALSPR